MSTSLNLNAILDELEDAYGLTPPAEELVSAFERWVASRGLELYPHQEEALYALAAGEHAVVASPTGSGKSLVAIAAIFVALARGGTSYYTAPLKALVSEKFFDMVEVFGAHNVGMVTGDSSINAGAPVVCATAEILANIALREGARADVAVAISDEFHYYGDPQRGWAWQVPLLELPQAQHVLLSGTLGDMTAINADLEERTGRTVAYITGAHRPVPLVYSWSVENLPELVHDLCTTHQAPAYVVFSSQKAAVEGAQSFLNLAVATKEQKEAIAAALGGFKFGPGFGQKLSRLIRAGIGVHHAGVLPRYRRLVEKLAQAGVLRVICGTDTLGVGINVPIRTVVMTSLAKFDGRKQRHLHAREFHQIAGRAGRAGFDSVGYVIAQAPEHEIENAKARAKAGDDPKKLAKLKLKKAEEGTISWSESTFKRLCEAEPEVLVPRLTVTHSMVLAMLKRPGNGWADLMHLLTHNHLPAGQHPALVERAEELYQTLIRCGVIVEKPAEWREAHPEEPPVEFAVDVPDNFVLNSPLAPFALAVLDMLDPESPEYPLDVISVMEAVQEDPKQILFALERAEKSRVATRLKNEGVGYHELVNELDGVTWPQPLKEQLEAALDIYANTSPWVLDYELHPKSILRAMVEEGLNFTEFISRYQVGIGEGVLLRYLTDLYKALKQTVPPSALTPELAAIIDWTGTLLASVDSSLLAEWEALRDGRRPDISEPTGDELAFGSNADGSIDFARNRAKTTRDIRNALFQRVDALYADDYDSLEAWDSWCGWDADRWEDAMEPYWDTYDFLGIDDDARSSQFFHLNTSPTEADYLSAGCSEDEAAQWAERTAWLAHQIFDDGEGDNSWGIWAAVDLTASTAAGHVIVTIVSCREDPLWN